MRDKRPRSAIHVASVVALLLAAPAASAETALDRRPSDRLTPETAERLAAIAAEIGWGSLFRTEQMIRADSAYGPGPVIAVTASPYLPVMFYLESRAWAVERFLSLEEADRRFGEAYVDPGDGMVFDLLLISEEAAPIEEEAIAIAYHDDSGTVASARLVSHEMTLEPALGGSLYATRAQLRVDFDGSPDWPAIGRMGLRVETADSAFDLDWTFADDP